jgi:hypothetical protein
MDFPLLILCQGSCAQGTTLLPMLLKQLGGANVSHPPSSNPRAPNTLVFAFSPEVK